MARLNDLLGFLRSLWGILATVAMLFPGAATFLQLGIAPMNSHLKGWYPTLATTVATFGLLFLTTYKPELRTLLKARGVAMTAICVAIVAAATLFGVRTVVLDTRSTRVFFDERRGVSVRENREFGEIRHTEVVSETLIDFEAPLSPGAATFSDSFRADPWDLVGLACFVATVTAITLAFGALGIHEYVTNHLDLP